MSKIRALNEDSSSSESGDETEGKLSKEAQEELAKLQYNQALKTLAEGRKKDATELFEKILTNPCLTPNQDDAKQFTPFQHQLQLGCLKILGDLYRDVECQDLNRAKIMYERALYFDQDENINLWYRLGKVSYETGDLYMAYNAFSYGLRLRPSHWGCLEHIVTVSYAVQDFTGCLSYCALGLNKDPGFIKGLVFRDLIYKVLPELKDSANSDIKNRTALNSVTEYSEHWKEKYVAELRTLQCYQKDRIKSIRIQTATPNPKVHFNLKSLSHVEVIRELLAAYENVIDLPIFHKPVELSWTVHDINTDSDDVSKLMMTEESQTEEESQLGIRRSRSLSNDKETAPGQNPEPEPPEADGEKKPVENTTENSQLPDSQVHNAEGDAGNKKKKRDLKWWQMEGKRRSQRVRGHLIPVSPDKTKKESSFADQLKNLIPAPLLGDDGSISEKESAKASDKSMWQKKTNLLNYFGSKEEEMQVKHLLSKMTGMNLASMLIKLTQFLTNEVKYPWPTELRELFLVLYKYYRSHVLFPDIQTYHLNQIITNGFASLVFVEIVTEKYKIELASGDKTFLELAVNEIYFLDDCLTSTHNIPTDFILRVKWLTVRRFLQMASTSNDEEANNAVSIILAEIEAELHQNPITIWTVNENANLICLESVSEKSAGIAKMQNSQIITDLYQTQQYESLIGVLESCINFSEIEKRDLEDVLHYTVSLFKTSKPECIHQCLNLINQAIRFQDNSILAESLVLLEDIWREMMSQFSIQYKRSTVGSLLKILVSCERKPPPQESILSVPWCILHSVLFSLEREEPAFYLEEDTVPNSVLLLQMAHECISRSEKCCMDNGKLLLYTMKATLDVKKLEEYFGYDETRNCMEQAIFCLYSHPSKKSKVKNLKDHNSPGIILSWKMCPLLYNYYCPDELPEFDSYGSIGAEVEALFQRLLEIVPIELKPTDRQKEIQGAIDICEKISDLSNPTSFPMDLQLIYYLIGDYYFKSKEWSKAVTYYTWDLAVNSNRFDSWAAIALSLGETINTTLNTVDVIDFKDLLKQAQSTSHCFQNALQLQPSNMKLRIEFGSFVYAMHAYCSRLMKQHAADMDMDLFHMIEKAKEDFLNSSYKCFELIAMNSTSNKSSEAAEDEIWIHHYMLGKIYEKKLFEDESKEFLVQYELAGKLLHDQNAPYPSKMNYYSPPELAIEALEVYYRIHATILSMVEKIEYSPAKEKFYLQYIKRQENGPFIKCKQSKGEGGEGKKGKKGAEDTISKKDMAEITALMNYLLDETVKLVESSTAVSSEGTSSSSSSSEDETSTDSVKSVKPADGGSPPMSSYSLSEFRKRLQEKELREEKLATEAKICDAKPPSPAPPSPVEEEDIYEGLGLETNIFYNEFKDVKFGAVIAMCMKAMEECICRYPSHFKSYYRLAHTYIVFLKDAKRAKDYLMGSPALSQRKITGLFGEKKPTNFFNGIWRNPIDDIDRPGSFSYHMNKIMQLLLQVLSQLNDHQLLADIVLQLTKVPDNEKKYLSNPDREQFCQVALNNCVASARRKYSDAGANYHELGIEVFETYTKLQKHNPRSNPMGSVLQEIYKLYLKATGVNEEGATIEHAIRYFSLHVMAMKATTSRVGGKGALSMNSSDQQKAGEGAVPRKRGRRSLRQSSQEIATNVPAQLLENLGQELDIYNAVSAAFQARNYFEGQQQAAAFTSALISNPASLYPTMNLDAVQSAINPLFSLKNVDLVNKGNPPPAHDSNNSKSGYPLFVPTTSASKQHKPSNSGNYMAVNYAGNNKNTPSSIPDRQSEKEGESPSSSSSLQKPTKPKGVTARKSTTPKPAVNKQDKYPSAPTLPIRINTSPYKAQTTAVEQPPQFSFNKNSTTNRSNDTKTPPIAHYHPVPKPKESPMEEDDGVDVEVIDLTVKTPEKEGKAASLQQNLAIPSYPNVTISVVPPKPSTSARSAPTTKSGFHGVPTTKSGLPVPSPKPTVSVGPPRYNVSVASIRPNVSVIPQRASASTPISSPSTIATPTRHRMPGAASRPSVVATPSRPNVAATPSNTSVINTSSRPRLSIRSNVTIEPAPPYRPSVTVAKSPPFRPNVTVAKSPPSRPSVTVAPSPPSRPNPTILPSPPSRPSVLAAPPRQNVPAPSTKVVVPTALPKMKAAPSVRQPDKKPAYPLPPKKKHHQMVFRNVSSEDQPDGSGAPDDVEVIILD
ncbi:unnamed protein product [Orchesella dallaii]|uniref:Calcineurin-binding protein cabin-1 n=1 Tax=Orchesella dallaii TaxID=48710 RepID=A0ABP1PUF7_9HEXA